MGTSEIQHLSAFFLFFFVPAVFWSCRSNLPHAALHSKQGQRDTGGRRVPYLFWRRATGRIVGFLDSPEFLPIHQDEWFPSLKAVCILAISAFSIKIYGLQASNSNVYVANLDKNIDNKAASRQINVPKCLQVRHRVQSEHSMHTNQFALPTVDRLYMTPSASLVISDLARCTFQDAKIYERVCL